HCASSMPCRADSFSLQVFISRTQLPFSAILQLSKGEPEKVELDGQFRQLQLSIVACFSRVRGQ
ncbi:MAG: hypothetical protein ACREBQ_03770, partial [Nitrososphaerales archaeon]